VLPAFAASRRLVHEQIAPPDHNTRRGHPVPELDLVTDASPLHPESLQPYSLEEKAVLTPNMEKVCHRKSLYSQWMRSSKWRLTPNL
jgi:hypothetical protein